MTEKKQVFDIPRAREVRTEIMKLLREEGLNPDPIIGTDIFLILIGEGTTSDMRAGDKQ